MAILTLPIAAPNYIGLSSDTKPTRASHSGVPQPEVGSKFYERDTGLWYISYDGTNWAILKNPSGGGLATKTSSSPLTTGNLFTYTGTIAIAAIIGRVSTIVQNQATNCKLSVVADALAAYDICSNLDIDSFAAGSLLSITGTAANALVGTTAVGAIAPAQTNMVIATCVASGLITVTYGAASTGAIVWEISWIPLSSGASLVAA